MATCHAYICMLEWIACIAGFIYALKKEYPFAQVTAASLGMILAFPIFNELILCIMGAICKRKIATKDYSENHDLNECIPIVYSARYNIHAFGVEKLHPFDASKYRRIYEKLLE